MAVVRVCFVFVFIVCFSNIAGKPLFFTRGIYCDLFCDDEDISTTTSTSSSTEDDYDWFDCSDCTPRRRRTTTPRPGMLAPPGVAGSSPFQPLNVMIPPGQPMNVTLLNQGGSWLMSFMSGAGTATPAPAVAPAPAAPAAPADSAPAASAPAAAPAAADATTAAPAEATTAAA